MSSLIALLALITIIISCNGGLLQPLKNQNPIEIPPDSATNSENGCCAFTEGDTCYCTAPTDYKDCNCDSIKQLSIVYLGEITAQFIKFYDSFKHPLCKFNNINKGEELICSPLHIFTDRPFTDRTTFKIKNTNNEICSGYIDTSCTGKSILNTYGIDCDNIVISGYIDSNNGVCDDGYEPCICDAFNNVHFKSTISKLRLIIPAIPSAVSSPLEISSNINNVNSDTENDHNDNDIDIKTININNVDTNAKTADIEDFLELGPVIDNTSDDIDTGDESNEQILSLYNNIQTDTDSLTTDTKKLHKLILYGTVTGPDTDTGTGMARNAVDGIADDSDSNEHILMLYNFNNNNIDIDDDMNESVEIDIEPTESIEPFTSIQPEMIMSDPARMSKIKHESFSIKKHVNKITGTDYDMIAFYSILGILVVNVILFSYCLCIKKIVKKWNVEANRYNYQNGVRSSECDFVESSSELSELEVDNDDLTEDETEFENDFI